VNNVPARPKKTPRRASPRARVGRPKGKPSAETRAAIVIAARDQFVRVGYERATNRDIAAGAGVTAAAIYQYFESKTELYLAVATETLEEIVPRMRAAVAHAHGTRAALAAIIREYSGSAQHVISTRFLAGIPVEMQRHPEVAEAMVSQPGTFFEMLLEIIGRGVRTGEIAADKAERVVAVFIASTIGLAIHGGAIGGPHSEAAIQGLCDLLEGTLFREPPVVIPKPP
jgi:AcrR family transcriptional regulator